MNIEKGWLAKVIEDAVEVIFPHDTYEDKYEEERKAIEARKREAIEAAIEACEELEKRNAEHH